MVALGFGALALPSQELVPVAASAAATPVRTSLPASDQRPRPGAALRLVVYEEATPAPTAQPVAHQPAASPGPMAPMTARPAVGGGASAFTYGYCTWWVAHKRPIPWRGNAAEWWWNARPFGFAEGQAPRPGAIMVMGVSGTSPEGHVAYVESVGPNGSFTVSEMNWWGVPGGGWGRVDYRTVTSMRGILGFIY
jgi:surface antigen